MFRAVGAYLCGEFYRAKQGLPADASLEGLKALYRRLQSINHALAAQIRSSSDGDAHLNALVLLDLFAQGLPRYIDQGLLELEHMYRHILEE